MQPNVFGKRPRGSNLKVIQQSPNYRNGSFQNLSVTDMTIKGVSFFKLLKDFINKPKNATPDKDLPYKKTDLHALQTDRPAITWFGHSSYLIQYRTKNILVDPVFSGHASPVSFLGKSFPGTDIYYTNDFPSLDMLVLTHDHYDHLDFTTIKKMANKTKHFYAPLGVGSHLESWGIPREKITEFDWWQRKTIGEGIELTATPARHFSGRGFIRNKTLWTSYVLKIYDHTIFIGGDSGYDTHFKKIGDQFGPFDIAILETGQYNKSWPYIHMMPEEAIQATIDLRAKVLLPVHWGKFALAFHPWNEPIERVTKAGLEKNVQVTTPMIGEPVILDLSYPQKIWWNF